MVCNTLYGSRFLKETWKLKLRWQVAVSCVPTPLVGRPSLEDGVKDDSEANPGLPGRDLPDQMVGSAMGVKEGKVHARLSAVAALHCLGKQWTI